MASFRFWRVSNIQDNKSIPDSTTVVDFEAASLATLRFLTASGEGSTAQEYDPTKALDSGDFEISRPVSNVFDDFPTTLTQSDYGGLGSGAGASESVWIGYDFGTPREITSISVQPRQTMQSHWREEWRRCLVEGSDDGVVWVLVGQCIFNIPPMSLGLATAPIIPLDPPTEEKHPYWRVKDVVTKRSFPNIDPNFEVWRLRFIPQSHIRSVNPRNAVYNPDRASSDTLRKPSNAFDRRFPPIDATIGSVVPTAGEGDWWLGYNFIYPEAVSTVEVSFQQEEGGVPQADKVWVSATLESSDDGLIWNTAGYLVFIPPQYLSSERKGFSYSPVYLNKILQFSVSHSEVSSQFHRLGVTMPLRPRGQLISTSSEVTFSTINIATSYIEVLRESLANTEGKGVYGYISGKIYERVGDSAKKVPVSRRVYLYYQGSGALIASTWSGEDGVYLFKNLKLGSFFMVVSVDHTGKWGLEGAAYKQAKQVVIDDDTVQYPLN